MHMNQGRRARLGHQGSQGKGSRPVHPLEARCNLGCPDSQVCKGSRVGNNNTCIQGCEGRQAWHSSCSRQASQVCKARRLVKSKENKLPIL